MANNLSYIDISTIPTNGASSKTAKQDGYSYSGVIASQKMAENDLTRILRYREKIKSVAAKTGMDAAVIAAIMSRESRGGNALDANKMGDHSNAFGLMQIDKRKHTEIKGAWDSEEHILQAAIILRQNLMALKKDEKKTNWTQDQLLKGAIAAYNMGLRNIRNADSIDVGSTGNDYSNDVIARAQFFKKHGF